MDVSASPWPLAWRAGAPISRSRFQADVTAVMRSIAPGARLLNLCRDRYLFAVAFLAICHRGGTNVLPPSEAPEVIERLTREAAGAVDDRLAERIGRAAHADLPDGIEPGHPAAIVFTSGSTGTPRSLIKTWGMLQGAAAATLPGVFPQRCHVVATVPPQHMYGFEHGVMNALADFASIHAGRPFFPGDIAQALREVPAPRALVTTPIHLRSLIAADVALPELSRVISATAPLDVALAATIERRWACELHEVYGLSEAGSIATRRPANEPAWRPFPGVRLHVDDAGARVSAPYLPAAEPLQDHIRLHADGRFDLLGRHSDLIKVGGKRASLADLNACLREIPGVEDGVVFAPDTGIDGRLAALVVAPGLSPDRIASALARRFDPVFVPRPLRLVESLPRNATGKLAHDDLVLLLRKADRPHG